MLLSRTDIHQFPALSIRHNLQLVAGGSLSRQLAIGSIATRFEALRLDRTNQGEFDDSLGGKDQ